MVLKNKKEVIEKSQEIVLTIDEIIKNFPHNFREMIRFEDLSEYIIENSCNIIGHFNSEISFTVDTCVKIVLSPSQESILKLFPNFANFEEIFIFYQYFLKYIKKKINELLNSDISSSVEDSIELIMRIQGYNTFASSFFDYFDTEKFTINEIFKIIDIADEFGPNFVSGIIYTNSSCIPCASVFLRNPRFRNEIIQYVEKKFETVFKNIDYESRSMFEYFHSLKYYKAYNFKPETTQHLINTRNYFENYFRYNIIFSCRIAPN